MLPAMASIRKRGDVYGAQFRVPAANGTWKLVSQSTELSDAKAAQRKANEMEQKALTAAGAGTKRGEQFCDVLLQAIREANTGKLTELKARAHMQRITEIARGKSIEAYSVRSWLDEYLRMKGPNVVESTHKAYDWAYSSFLTFLGDRADSPLETVEVVDVRTWRDQQKESGLSDKRVNNLLRYLSGPFVKATRNGILHFNPVAAVEHLRVKDSIARKPFTPEEVQRLSDACPTPEWRCVLLLGVYCGMRLGDASRRKIGDFDLENQTVSFLPKKKARTGRIVTLPLHPTIFDIVSNLTKSGLPKPDDWLTPQLAKTAVSGKVGLSVVFLTIMEAAKVDRGQSTEGAGRGRTRFARSFHSTRHTAATWLSEGGVAEDLRMLLTDHESKEVARRYTHQSIEQLRVAVQSMPNLTITQANAETPSRPAIPQ